MPNIITSKTRGYYNVKPPVGAQINWGHPLSKGLVGCWLMNEGGGGRCKNYASPIGDGTFTNDSSYTTWKKTKFGNALQCADSGQNAIALLGNYPNISGDITIVSNFLYTSPSATRYHSIITKRDGQNTTTNYAFRRGTVANPLTNCLSFFHYNNGWHIWEQNEYDLSANIYYTVAVTYNGSSNPRLFVNGRSVSGAWYAGTETTPAPLLTNSYNAYIGGLQYSAAAVNVEALEGHIVYLLVYNRILLLSEISSFNTAPYQFISKPRRVFYSVSAAVSGWVSGGKLKNIV